MLWAMVDAAFLIDSSHPAMISRRSREGARAGTRPDIRVLPRSSWMADATWVPASVVARSARHGDLELNNNIMGMEFD